MIAGVAQVVVNVEDTADEGAALERAGYRRTFTQLGLSNQPAKEPFQAAPRQRLDLAHFVPPTPGPAMELTAYDGGPPAGVAAYRLAGTRLSFSASRLEESLDFWTSGLGFRADALRLTFPAPVPAWRLELDVDPGPIPDEEPTVDAQGCVLVTMVVTALEHDLERLVGGTTLRRSEIWEERVANRNLRVALVAGPSGELVELLEIASKA